MNMNGNVVRSLVFGIVLLTVSAASFGQVLVSVRIGPPPLPVYAQPICPGPGYFWTPGYWAWNDDGGYYWVPGTWVVAPVGLLWTPGYWGWGDGFYRWHGGYWGSHIGFYGGINYGYGYSGEGFYGGEWRGRNFYYNRSVTNVSVTNVTNVYNKTVIVNRTTVNNVSYNGGNGGIRRRPMPQELRAEHERHEAPIAMQTQHERLAVQNRQNFAAENHGRPLIAATGRAGDFGSRSVIPARAAGGEYHAPAMSPREARGPASPGNRPFAPENSNNTNRTLRPSTPGGQDKGNANGGFRPFNPPNSTHATPGGSVPNNPPSRNAGANPTHQEHGGGGTIPMRPSTPGGQDKGNANGGFRPFNPPNSTHATPGGSVPNNSPSRNAGAKPTYQEHGAGGTNPIYQDKGNAKTNPTYQEHGNGGTNPVHQPNDRGGRPPATNPPAPHASQPAPPVHHDSAPAPHRDNAPPPRRENPPKGDHNGDHNRGR